MRAVGLEMSRIVVVSMSSTTTIREAVGRDARGEITASVMRLREETGSGLQT